MMKVADGCHSVAVYTLTDLYWEELSRTRITRAS